MSCNIDKLVRFIPHKEEDMDKPLGKFDLNQMIINSVPCWQKISKKVSIFQPVVVKGLTKSFFTPAIPYCFTLNFISLLKG